MNSEPVCEWREVDGAAFEAVDCLETERRQLHTFTNGDPEDNDYAFCPYCGRRLEVHYD